MSMWGSVGGVQRFSSMSEAPSAAGYGVGPAWVGATGVYSDGTSWIFDCFRVPSGGTSDDHAVIDSVVQDAPEYASIILASGSTYTIDKTIKLKRGQRLIGNGATIKRASQATTTTTTTIAAGVTSSITVASTAGFRIGQTIVVYESATQYAAGVITGLDNNTITCGGKFYGSGVSGSNISVGVAGACISLLADCSIIDVIFNGNRASFSVVHWAALEEVVLLGDRANVTNCIFSDAPCEGIVEYAQSSYKTAANITAGDLTATLTSVGGLAVGDFVMADNSSTARESIYHQVTAINPGANVITVASPGFGASFPSGASVYRAGTGREIKGCSMLNIGGNGIHLSGSVGTVVESNVIGFTNLAGTVPGHVGGCITWSNYCNSAVCTNNEVYSTNYDGFGEIDSLDTSFVTIRGNKIRNCARNAVSIISGLGWNSKGHIVDGNTIISCGPLAVKQTNSGATTFPLDISIINNKLIETVIECYYSENIIISGNHVESSGTTGYGIAIDSCVHLLVQSNVIIGWYESIRVNSGAASHSKANLINCNNMRGFASKGINSNGTGLGHELVVSNNTIRCDSLAGSIGIYLQDKNTAIGNDVYNSAANSSGIVLNSASSAISNKVRKLPGTAYYAIRLSGAGGIAVYNLINDPLYVNGATPDAQTTTLGNITIA